FQHLHHAEHAVHRCADFVTHDGKERRFCLVRGLRLHARAVGGFPLGLSGFLGKRQGLLAPPHFGNVVVHGEQTAVVEVPVLVLDISAGFGAALVTIPTRRAHARRDLVYLGLDVGDFAVFASVDQVANEVVSGHTGIGDVARISVQIAVMLVAEAPTEILVEQRDSVGHIVEDALCHPISALDVVARRQCFGCACSAASRAASAASFAAASASSRSLSAVMSRWSPSTLPSANCWKLSSTYRPLPMRRS